MICVKEVYIQGNLRNEAYTTVAENINSLNTLQAMIKIHLVLDTQANGTAPAVNDVFKTSGFNDFRKIENTGRFKILKTKKFIHNPQVQVWGDGPPGTVSGYQQPRLLPFAMYWKGNIPITYGTGTGNGLADVRDNNLLVLAQVTYDSNGGQASFIHIDGKVRVRYEEASAR